jgi:hypothetical protein
MPAPSLHEWLQLAPTAAALRAPQKYHIFISYRSVNRLWALDLYDLLTQLGYVVFLDQFVLAAGNALASSLGEALQASRAATMIWSSSFEDSKWCMDEYNALMARRNDDSSFQFVIVTVDAAKVPPLAAGSIRLDFSADRDGPIGGNLLRLLHGLRGDPLPANAVKFASDFDALFAAARTRIRTARELGDKSWLAELAQSTELPWQTSAALGCEVADALVGLKDTDAALGVLDLVQARFPRALRPKQLRGLALARSGRSNEAAKVLGQLYVDGEMDPETVGLYARTWMDRYKVTKDLAHLRKSRDLYLQMFDLSKDSYNGVNAATKSLLLGEAALSLELATRVEKIVGSKAIAGNYWATATVAEVQLLQSRFAEAASLYRDAVQCATEDHGSHGSTSGQARLILATLNAAADVQTNVMAAFDHPGCRE